MVDQLTGLVGPLAAQAIQELLTAAQERTAGIAATIVGVITMLIAATTIVVELQDDLDQIWKAPKRTGNGWLTILRARILSLGMILGVGFLLLVSLVINGALEAFGAFSAAYFPGATVVLLRGSLLVFSFVTVTLLFAMLYKSLPNASIAWRDVWTGAFTTAVLFSAGRVVIGVYLGRGALGSAYGAAGTLVVLLLWLYYSAQVFLLGAEFTCVHAKHRLARPQRVLAADQESRQRARGV
jgi:membrane protein